MTVQRFLHKRNEKRHRVYRKKIVISVNFQGKSIDIAMQKGRDYIAKALTLPCNSIDITR